MGRTGSASRKALVLFGAVWSASCGDDAPSRDAAVDEGATDTDAASPALEWPELSVGTTADPDDPTRIGLDSHPADLSCAGNWDWPPPSAPQPLDLLLWRDLQPDQPLAGACYRVYPDNVVDDDAPCRADDPRTDAMGRVTISVAYEAPFAIRVFPTEGATPRDRTEHVLNVDIRAASRSFASQSFASTPDDATLLVIPSEAGSALIPVLFGNQRAPDTAIVGVALRDCADEPVYGARLRIARADGSYVEMGDGRTDPAVGYFDAAGALLPAQTWTHVGGVAAMLNVPPGQVFVEMWGRPAGETEPRVIACGVAPAEGDRTTQVHVLEPVRRSGPACPGLAER